jgi:glycosyltransferase involved in cell wall biosynthesis
MKLLFVKHTLAWPRVSGHDVHAFHLMQACVTLGHQVVLATAVPPAPEAIDGIRLTEQIVLPAKGSGLNGHGPLRLSKLQERFRSYWGIPEEWVAGVQQIAESRRVDAVVAVGLDALPFLPGHRGVKVWYAADEWMIHHLSLAKAMDDELWEHLRAAAVKGAYERVYAPSIDRAWVVSPPEARAMRWLAGFRAVDIVPNGVDSEYFRPLELDGPARSAVFWGRLDFGPNVQGLQWFCRKVWPLIRQDVPDAQFVIVGFHPGTAVRQLAEMDGVTLVPDVPDLRREVSRHSVVALPFVSGGGIKNKLLEAASMGKAIVTTRKGCGGLDLPDSPPFVVAQSADEWHRAVLSLWSDDKRRQQLGLAAREWVVAHHTWSSAAARALAGIAESLERPKA